MNPTTWLIDVYRQPNTTPFPMSKLTYNVKRGKNTGTKLAPHWYTDGGGYFLAHKTNSRNDPEGKRVTTEAELIELVRQGYHVRMSNMAKGHAPSTVKPTISV